VKRLASGLALTLALAAPAAPARAQPEPPADLAAAGEALEAGRLEEAERRLRARLETLGGDPVTHDLLGMTLGRMGRHAEAEEHFLRAVEGGLPLARPHLARLYLLQERETEAVDQLRRFADTDPDGLERDLALKLAIADLAAGETVRAERQLRSIGERFESVQALVLLARLQLSRGEPEAALGTLDRARELAPNAEPVLDAEARAGFVADRLPRALTALDALARMHPAVPEYPYRLGLAQMRIGDVQGAVAALEHARELDPTRVSIHVALGLALNAQSRYEESRDAFETVLRFEPAHTLALGGLSEAVLGLGRLEEAEALARRTLALDPDQGAANLTIGIVRLKQERYEEARGALLRAAEASPDDSKVHYQLSLVHARLGDPEASRRALERYRQLKAEREGGAEGGT
jgi:tetratricopeptide (TPR) repeat protein